MRVLHVLLTQFFYSNFRNVIFFLSRFVAQMRKIKEKWYYRFFYILFFSSFAKKKVAKHARNKRNLRLYKIWLNFEFFESVKKYIWVQKCALCVYICKKKFWWRNKMRKWKKNITIISLHRKLAFIFFVENVIFFFAKNRYF